MRVSCKQCPAKYSISDDKLRGRKIKVKCKRCGADIIVNGKHLAAENSSEPSDSDVEAISASSSSSLALSNLPLLSIPPEESRSTPPARRQTATQKPTTAKPAHARGEHAKAQLPHGSSQDSNALDQLVGARTPRSAHPPRSSTPPPKPSQEAVDHLALHVSLGSATPLDECVWTVAAVKGDLQLSTAELLSQVRLGVVLKDTLVWTEALGQWQRLRAVEELQRKPSLTPEPPRHRSASKGPPLTSAKASVAAADAGGAPSAAGSSAVTSSASPIAQMPALPGMVPLTRSAAPGSAVQPLPAPSSPPPRTQPKRGGSSLPPNPGPNAAVPRASPKGPFLAILLVVCITGLLAGTALTTFGRARLSSLLGATDAHFPAFDLQKASWGVAVAGRAAERCFSPESPQFQAQVAVVFAEAGHATQATVSGPLAESEYHQCVIEAFKGARVPPFSGAPAVVKTTFAAGAPN